MENKMNEKESDITNEVRILNNLRRIDKHLLSIKIGVFIIAMCALIPTVANLREILFKFW
jgi:hypothetical protein